MGYLHSINLDACFESLTNSLEPMDDITHSYPGSYKGHVDLFQTFGFLTFSEGIQIENWLEMNYGEKMWVQFFDVSLKCLNPINPNTKKWSDMLNNLSVVANKLFEFDHFAGLALKGLKYVTDVPFVAKNWNKVAWKKKQALKVH